MATALTGFAADSGVSVSAPPELVKGLVSQDLQGSYTVQVGLSRLLQGTGLEAAARGSKHYVLRKSPEGATSGAAAETTLPQVTVMAAALDATSEGSRSYGASAASIGKSTQALREIPQSISVVTRQRLDDQNLRTLDDALLNAPGITVEQSSSYERTFYSRGFAVDTVQYDGVPTQRGNGFAVSPDLAVYDRVEVLRGPAGLFNGAGQPGGTVNLVRKRPLETRQLTAQVSAGTWDNYRAGVDLSLPLNDAGTVRSRFVAAQEDKKFFYDVAESKRSVFYGIVEADIGPRTTLGAGISYEKNDMTPFYGGLPRYSNGKDLGLPRSTYLNAAWSSTEIESTTLFADLNHRFNDDWKLKISISRMHEDNSDLSGSNFGTVNPATNLGPTLSSFRQKLDGKQTAIDATLQGSFAAYGRKHDVIVGVNYQQREYDLYSQLYTVANPNVNPFTFNPYNYAVAPTQVARAATNTLNKLDQTGMYGSLRFALSDPLKLIVGARVSQWETSTRNQITGAFNTQPYKESGNVTPYAALTYDIDPVWTVYGSYTEIFRSQANQFTAAGERLDPATGDNYEAGIKGTLLDGRLNASLAVFRTLESNRSQTDPNNPTPCAGSPTNGACFIAEGKVRSQGLDAELNGALSSNWQLAAGYTYNQTRYLRDSTATGAPSANQNQPLSTFTPRHIVRLWSNHQLPNELSAWSAGIGVNLQSKTYKTSGTLRFEQAAYAVWSTRLAYKFNKNLTAALNINNLFDKNYYRTLGSTTGGNWYGEPRNAMLTLQATY
ncbi:TonB-dependent siderophore receptor [Herminiimonas aquatilis]|uniref:TonB-dependent siderophore receptor n=1 Tax=Herminiimonas aquatilis TaxID=345342 RepID=A0ABW2J5J7_9BURK